MNFPVDLKQTAWYFKLSADVGQKAAWSLYAECLWKVEGVPQDIDAAIRYYEMVNGDAMKITDAALGLVEAVARSFFE